MHQRIVEVRRIAGATAKIGGAVMMLFVLLVFGIGMGQAHAGRPIASRPFAAIALTAAPDHIGSVVHVAGIFDPIGCNQCCSPDCDFCCASCAADLRAMAAVELPHLVSDVAAHPQTEAGPPAGLAPPSPPPRLSA